MFYEKNNTASQADSDNQAKSYERKTRAFDRLHGHPQSRENAPKHSGNVL